MHSPKIQLFVRVLAILLSGSVMRCQKNVSPSTSSVIVAPQFPDRQAIRKHLVQAAGAQASLILVVDGKEWATYWNATVNHVDKDLSGQLSDVLDKSLLTSNSVVQSILQVIAGKKLDYWEDPKGWQKDAPLVAALFEPQDGTVSDILGFMEGQSPAPWLFAHRIVLPASDVGVLASSIVARMENSSFGRRLTATCEGNVAFQFVSGVLVVVPGEKSVSLELRTGEALGGIGDGALADLVQNMCTRRPQADKIIKTPSLAAIMQTDVFFSALIRLWQLPALSIHTGVNEMISATTAAGNMKEEFRPTAIRKAVSGIGSSYVAMSPRNAEVDEIAQFLDAAHDYGDVKVSSLTARGASFWKQIVDKGKVEVPGINGVDQTELERRFNRMVQLTSSCGLLCYLQTGMRETIGFTALVMGSEGRGTEVPINLSTMNDFSYRFEGRAIVEVTAKEHRRKALLAMLQLNEGAWELPVSAHPLALKLPMRDVLDKVFEGYSAFESAAPDQRALILTKVMESINESLDTAKSNPATVDLANQVERILKADLELYGGGQVVNR